ncbi:hypothetical protein [Aromatoleum bremense]|uniref:DUF4148 domain-containing protein n=1 Tax=Aromatoleum bremense TaxID=76115 RepID=A0ABX1NXR2_9RHOO|nr:hypothetical protein [Aromatoleum bremense]NMG16828.1 hypothetical protein [Aromatoleum bremense]QTQ33671.1 Uncharacterized protein pbN1_36860 [Aromatoleum bremense]
MNTRSAFLAAMATLALIVPPSMAAPDKVRDQSFDEQARAVQERVELKQDAGVFGRPGDVPGEEGPRGSSVGDRDLDRYVQRLGFEIRMRNAIADRDSAGFH